MKPYSDVLILLYVVWGEEGYSDNWSYRWYWWMDEERAEVKKIPQN